MQFPHRVVKCPHGVGQLHHDCKKFTFDECCMGMRENFLMIKFFDLFEINAFFVGECLRSAILQGGILSVSVKEVCAFDKATNGLKLHCL